jgi:RNA polymerase sigma-70 factor, ECF subfamily
VFIINIEVESINWQKLVDEHYKEIYSYCFHFFNNASDAADATQDVYVKAIKNRTKLALINENERRFWLYRVARNVCIDKKRWWKRFLLFKSEYLPDSTPTTDAPLIISLQKAIAELPNKQKEVFILRHWNGFSTTETAQLLGIDEGSVKSHLSRAIAKLKKHFIDLDHEINKTTKSTHDSLRL